MELVKLDSPMTKVALLFLVTLAVILLSFFFMIAHHDDLSNRVYYSLTDHKGRLVTEQDYGGRYQIVFFGFTNCDMICPTQMHKLTEVMHAIDEQGKADQLTPIFITVDPERDTPERIDNFLTYYHERFIGLTGSRTSLEQTANTFKTLMVDAPKAPVDGYQITHSSVVYLVDPFMRLVDFIPYDTSVQEMAERIKFHL